MCVSLIKPEMALCAWLLQIKKKKKMNITTTFVNARVFVSQQAGKDRPVFASCLKIRHDAIVWVGSPPESDTHGDTVIDLGGRLVLPGFVDGHVHLLQLGQALQKLDLTHCETLDDIRSAVRSYAAENPSKERILCRGWMHSMTASHGQVNKSMLDDLDPGRRPIYVDSKDLHSAWCNSAALAELDVATVPDPQGGKIHRADDGSPTGLLEEAACVGLVWPFLAGKMTHTERLGSLLAAAKSLSSHGYTGAVDMAMDEDSWAALLAIRDQLGEAIPLRIAAHWFVHPKETDEENLRQVDRAVELSRQYNSTTSPDLRVVGIKLMCDGVVDACTAHLTEPYSHDNKAHPPLLWELRALERVVRKADEKGLQCALHAIGDGAVKLALDALEKGATPGRRHRIEHLELTSPGDAQRLAQQGITASIQPVHADPAILGAWPRLIGQHRCARAFAYRDFADAGAKVAIGTDAPTASHAPMGNMYVACTRRSSSKPDMRDTVNEEFRLGLCETVAAATRGSAYSSFDDRRVGELKVGLKADFTIVDMARWEAGMLLEATVDETWFGGRRVFKA